MRVITDEPMQLQLLDCIAEAQQKGRNPKAVELTQYEFSILREEFRNLNIYAHNGMTLYGVKIVIGGQHDGNGNPVRLPVAG